MERNELVLLVGNLFIRRLITARSFTDPRLCGNTVNVQSGRSFVSALECGTDRSMDKLMMPDWCSN